MTTYNTQNPIGSTSPKDLYDNAENLDVLLLDQDKMSHPDRLGVPRWTWHGMEQRFAEFLANSGYQFLADYEPTAGIEITEYNQLLRDSTGNLWRLDPSVPLPYTTDGSGMPEGGAFLSAGDASALAELEQFKVDLDDPAQGGDLVGVTTETGAQTLSEALDSRAAKQEVTLTVNIPTDYPTIQEAIDDLSTLIVKRGALIDVVIESGHSPSSGASVENGDFGHFRISSENAVVAVSEPFTGEGFVVANNARGPVLNCLVDFLGGGPFNAVLSQNGSVCVVNPGCGCMNGTRGAHASNVSRIHMDSAVFTGFQQAGAHSSRTSDIQCSFADLSGNSQDPANTFGVVYASRSSRIHGADIDASGSGGDGVRAQRKAVVSVPGIDVSGATKIALVAVSKAEIYSGNNPPVMNDLKGPAIFAQQGASVTIDGIPITFSAAITGNAVEARGSGSYIHMDGSSLSGHGGYGIYCTDAASVGFRAGSVTGGSNAVYAEHSGTVNATLSNLSNGSGNGAYAHEGGRITMSGASSTGFSGSDLAVTSGGIIDAVGSSTSSSSGSPALSDTNLPNGFNITDNGTRGIIWG